VSGDIMGLVLKCKLCGTVCTYDYVQITHYVNGRGEVIGVYCSVKCSK